MESVTLQPALRAVRLMLKYLLTGGSFAENFYGMKRRRRPGVSSERAQAAADLFSDHQKLRKRELRWSLFFLVRPMNPCY